MRTLGFLMILGLTAIACHKSESDSLPENSAQGSTESAARSPVAGVDAVLKDYEAIRGLLAADKTDGVARAAGRLEESAKGAIAGAPESMKKPLEDLAGRAAKLKTELGDIGQARSAFGDLSRAFVQLLAAAPPLRQGRHIFECPMAEGYQKWVQVSSEMANPYMGKKMLKCGSEATWIP